VNEQSEHLSNAQIENYGDRAFDAGSGADHEAEQIEAHLDGCPSCRSRMLDFQRTHFALLPDLKFVISKDANLKDTDSKPTDAELSDAGRSDAKLSAPKLADSKFADPKFEDPNFADPKFADAKFIDPKFTDPKHLTDQQVNTASTPDCPSGDDLRQLSAGLLPDPVADKLTRHAATCDHCGPLLRAYTEDFSDDFSPEQQAVLANLQSSSAAWQKKTARQMLSAAGASAAVVASTATASSPSANASTAAATSTNATANPETAFSLPSTTSLPNRKSSAHPGRKTFFWKRAFVPAATAVCALIAFSIWFTQRDTPEKVEKLLAQAYTEQRTMEMRIPYAEHSDFHQERGESGSLLQLPDSYKEASNKITTNLKEHPDDPKWMLLSVRFDLLHWDYKAAVSTLERLDNNKVPESAEIRLARAIALYERADFEPEHRDQLYAEIIELMGKTLQQDPTDATALFNQALACEKSNMFECASADYKHLLEVEKDSGWAHEAQKNLSRIEVKKKKEQ
jgi:hypothetical protein